MRKPNLRLLIYFPILLRLTCPFIVFRYPFTAIIINYLFDCWDGFAFNKLGYGLKTYRFIDQLLDFYWLTFILIYLIFNRPELIVFFSSLFFFLLRFVGVIIFITSRRENHFLFFPNVFEHLFWVYVISKQFNLPQLTKFPLWVIIILILTLLKAFNEYLIHQKKFSLLNTITRKKILRWSE